MDPVSIVASSIAFIGAYRKLASGLRFLRDLSQAPEDILALTDELTDLQNVLTAMNLVTCERQDDILGTLLSPLFAKVDRIIHELCDWLDISHISSELNKISIGISGTRQRSREPLIQLGNPPQYEANPMQIISISKPRAVDLEAQEQAASGAGKSLDPGAPRIRSDDLKRGPCKRACSCACHSVYRVKTPSILQSLVGSLLIESNGLYGMNQPCIEYSCRRSASASIRLSYRFPEWLLNRMVSSLIVSNHLNGPQLSLIVPRVLPNTSDIFFHTFAGNIDAIANLFQSGLASPCDVSETWGYTPLHYAVDKRHMDLCRFLLKPGARADITDMEENSVTDKACNQICSKQISSQDAAELETMFNQDAWFEERQFTILHKIVLDLLPARRSLQQELSTSTREIDIGDSEGRTPLSWATEHDNSCAVEILLRHGASTSSKSIMGMTPLHYAVKAPSPTCLSILLDNGASVSTRNKWNQSPLNLAAYFKNDPSYITPLLDHGAVINERDSYSSTPLSNALFMNNDLTARYLISHGANITNNEAPGLTSFNDAIENNSHECVSLLFDKGASLPTIGLDGETALHVFARRGNLRTIEIFQAADLVGLDVHAKTNAGLTAWDLMAQRVDMSDTVESAFQNLIAKLDSENSRVTYFDTGEEMMPPACGKIPDLVEVKVEEIQVG